MLMGINETFFRCYNGTDERIKPDFWKIKLPGGSQLDD